MHIIFECEARRGRRAVLLGAALASWMATLPVHAEAASAVEEAATSG